MKTAIERLRRFLTAFPSKFKFASFSNETEGEGKIKIFPSKILEIAEGYIVVFDRDFEPADPVAEVATDERGKKAGFLAFGSFWVPLEEIDIKRYAGGFKMYMVGSPGLKARVVHCYEFSGENIGKLFMLQYALKKCRQEKPSVP